jgi:hypothetical protein
MLTAEAFTPIDLPASSPAQLFIIVDTEEEFDWSAPFSRESVGVTAIQEVPRLQQAVAPYRLKPTYVVDYPVAATPSSAETLGAFAHAGDCRIGAHLHPWVTPPFDEPLVPEMSFGCNLGASIEQAKLQELTGTIATRLNVRPRVFKAGRYGLGTSTVKILESLEYDVDTSVIPHMDFRAESGPSFLGFSPKPALFGTVRRLLELPCTTGFTGAARRLGESLHGLASSAALQPLRAVGILSRSGLLNRVMLSPEGNGLDEMKALTRALHADGVRTFALTFHSPSLKPGCTPYVKTAADRDAFLDTITRYCDFFFTEMHGRPTTAEELFEVSVGGGSSPPATRG